MSLPFLRPSPPPSALFVRSVLRGGSTSIRAGAPINPLRRHLSTSTQTQASSPPSSAVPTGSPPAPDTKSRSAPAPNGTAPVSSPPPISPTAQDTQFEPLPYHVTRTAGQNLPVYHDIKAGGTLKQTLVRHIQGDRDALRQRLLDELPALLKPEHVRINRLTGHIVIKGHVAREVAGVLRGLHF